MPHGADLDETAKRIDHPGTRIRFYVVEDDAHAGAGGLQNVQGAEHFLWKAPCGPGQRRVLDENPRVAPLGGHTLQRIKCLRPAVDFPRYAANFQLNIVSL